MEAVIVGAHAPLATRAVLGLSLLQRAGFTALDAGAEVLHVDGEQAALQLAADARFARPVRALTAEGTAGERLVLRADALVAPELLRELALGEGIADRAGVMVAARVQLTAGEDPTAALAAARPRPFTAGRYRYALCVADRGQLRPARALLLGALVKPSDGPVSRHFNRHLSRAITCLLLPLGVTPNQTTVLVALAGLFAAYYAAQPNAQAQLIGALLFQLHSVIDGCDGEIARLTRNFGKHGALIDSLVDDASNTLFFAGLSCGVAGLLGMTWPFYTAAITVGCYAAVALIQYQAVLRSTGKGEKTAFWRGEIERRAWPLRALHALGRRDVFVLVILIAVGLGLAPVVVAVLPFMAVGALTQSWQRARAAATAG